MPELDAVWIKYDNVEHTFKRVLELVFQLEEEVKDLKAALEKHEADLEAEELAP